MDDCTKFIGRSQRATLVETGPVDLQQTCALHLGRNTQELSLDYGRQACFTCLWFLFYPFVLSQTPHPCPFSEISEISSLSVAISSCALSPPDLVLNVTTKTDTIWSFSSHFTILSSSDASLAAPESERCSSASGRGASSAPAGVLEVAAGALLQPSASETDLLGVGPPGLLLHPNPGALHPKDPRPLDGLACRSFPLDVPPGFSAGGISSQSSRGARSDRSTILSAVPASVSPQTVNDVCADRRQVHPWRIPSPKYLLHTELIQSLPGHFTFCIQLMLCAAALTYRFISVLVVVWGAHKFDAVKEGNSFAQFELHSKLFDLVQFLPHCQEFLSNVWEHERECVLWMQRVSHCQN